MPATPPQLKKYRQKLRQRARAALGKRACILCGKKHRKLEMAHIAPTKLAGASRGMDRRYLDVIRNPGYYRWMGKKCHHLFDKLMKIRESLREAGEEPTEEGIPF